MHPDGANRGPELLLCVRRGPGAPPLGSQIEAGLRDAIRERRIAPGQRLPPTRTLASDLGVARALVLAAYEQLAAEGWLDARVGSGTYVRRSIPDPPWPPPTTPPAQTGGQPSERFDFFPGHPALAEFPRSAWAHATRHVLRDLPDTALGYGDPAGLPALRDAVASMLARTRRVVCTPQQIVICQGTVQALGLLVRAATDDRSPVGIAVEDPYLPEHRDLLSHAGAEIVPVPVDELGIRDEAVAAARCSHVLLTPAHQMPTGVALTAGRRAALATWAQREGALLIEDDYDAEYRYDRSPVAALQALAPGHVAYLGSASKTLAPGLRLAWLVLPDDRLEGVIAAKRYADAGSPVIEQATLAHLITSGVYDQHVRAARRRQRQRRNALIGAIDHYMPDTHVEGAAAGLHALLRLPIAVDAAALTAAASERDVRIYPLNLWRADPPPDTSGIVLGYGNLPPTAITHAIQRLADAWRSIQ